MHKRQQKMNKKVLFLTADYKDYYRLQAAGRKNTENMPEKSFTPH
jgi:hypothetical protein